MFIYGNTSENTCSSFTYTSQPLTISLKKQEHIDLICLYRIVCGVVFSNAVRSAHSQNGVAGPWKHRRVQQVQQDESADSAHPVLRVSRQR